MRAEEIHKISKVYMLGIGGIGMSALARFFLLHGKIVSGYDRVSTRLTDDLIREGCQIHFSTDLSLIKEQYPNAADLLVVYTPAIPEDHLELQFFRKGGYQIVKRAQMLGILTRGEKSIAIAGTHGKTTVSTLVTHLLKTADVPCNAFLGGISRNYGSNGLFSRKTGWFVLEADEFDRSFLNLHPDLAVVTSCDPDHLDIYGTPEKMKEAFCQFIAQISEGGSLIQKVPLELDCPQRLETMTYSTEVKAHYRARNIRVEKGEPHFDIETPTGMLTDVRLGIPGHINVENALAVVGLSRKLGLDDEVLRRALETFRGVVRRFDVRIRRNDMVYIDDYAHHPRELDACIQSVRKMHPGRRITGIFQPHLFSRTRDFAEGFAKSLQQLDELILLGIYPAREKPIEGITARTIFDRVVMEHKIMIEKDQLMKVLEDKKPDVLLTLGAGDIDQFVEPIEKLYSKDLKG